MNTYSIQRINALCRSLNRSIDRLSTEKSRIHTGELGGIREQIDHVVAQCSGQLSAQKITLDRLTDPSRRAYQWLLFLQHPRRLTNHISTLQEIRAFSKVDSKTTINLFFQTPLIKYNRDHTFNLHQGFTGAPQRILRRLGEYIANPKNGEAITPIKDYTLDERFIRTTRQLVRMGIAEPSLFARGEHQDLNTVFDSVNRRYFQGAMQKPLISWTPRTTYRKFGQYDFSSDQLLISKTLDQPATPAHVLSYLMYHELLHKRLGLRHTESRKTAHTHQFRELERQHDRYQDASDYLEKISRKIRKKKTRRKR